MKEKIKSGLTWFFCGIATAMTFVFIALKNNINTTKVEIKKQKQFNRKTTNSNQEYNSQLSVKRNRRKLFNKKRKKK